MPKGNSKGYGKGAPKATEEEVRAKWEPVVQSFGAWGGLYGEGVTSDSESWKIHGSGALPATLNSFERQVVHKIAEESGLAHVSQGEGHDKHIVLSRRLPTEAELAELAERKKKHEAETLPSADQFGHLRYADQKKCPEGHMLAVFTNTSSGYLYCSGCGAGVASGEVVMDCRDHVAPGHTPGVTTQGDHLELVSSGSRASNWFLCPKCLAVDYVHCSDAESDNDEDVETMRGRPQHDGERPQVPWTMDDDDAGWMYAMRKYVRRDDSVKLLGLLKQCRISLASQPVFDEESNNEPMSLCLERLDSSSHAVCVRDFINGKEGKGDEILEELKGRGVTKCQTLIAKLDDNHFCTPEERPTVGRKVVILSTANTRECFQEGIGKEFTIIVDAKDGQPYQVQGHDVWFYESDVQMEISEATLIAIQIAG